MRTHRQKKGERPLRCPFMYKYWTRHCCEAQILWHAILPVVSSPDNVLFTQCEKCPVHLRAGSKVPKMFRYAHLSVTVTVRQHKHSPFHQLFYLHAIFLKNFCYEKSTDYLQNDMKYEIRSTKPIANGSSHYKEISDLQTLKWPIQFN